MTVFVVYMLMWVMWFPVHVYVNRKTPNRPLIKCSACGSYLYQRPRAKRWIFADRTACSLLLWFTVWRYGPSLIAIPLATILIIAWVLMTRRLIHAYWIWRHPLRCGEGGHLKPAPTPV